MAESYGSNGSSRKTFYSIQGGKLTRKAVDGVDDERAVTLEGKSFKVVQPESITGVIRSMKFKDVEFDGKNGKTKVNLLEIELEDGIDLLVLSIPTQSKFFDTFAAKVENISPVAEVKIMPYSFLDKKNDKQVSGINLFQGDEKVEYRYTKDNPGNRPTTDGPLSTDEYKLFQLQLSIFYKKVVSEFAAKHFGDAPVSAAADTTKPKSRAEIIDKAKQEFEQGAEDDLPF